ncbi:TRAP transporter small permease [Halioxenophilus aromaticivorans]|uniref:TRAP transporter small permease protein n=1 Tax=Halioxenophilus aromaticivorans TaxID=1306992 RepID=A0AAV3U5A9_9ALTE
MFTALVAQLDKGFRFFLASLIALMVLCVTWQIVSRYVLGDPSQWTEELARFLLIWIGLLGGAYAYHVKMHLGLDILSNKLTGSKKVLHALFVHVLVILFSAAVLIVGGLRIVQMTTELKQYSAALEVPMAFIYSALPISGVMLILYAAIAIIETLAPQAMED